MMRRRTAGLTILMLLLAGAALAQTALTYAPDGKMLRPQDYRGWVFLSSGFDMSYTDAAAPKGHVFNNVFVNRESYDAFRKTGAWPDRTVLVLETRGGSNDDPVLKRGQFQAGAPTGVSVHVKDSTKGGWAFYAFGKDGTSAAAIPKSADCYSCHATHAASDTTFTQFYPELAATPPR
jgi:hypothetical protein